MKTLITALFFIFVSNYAFAAGLESTRGQELNYQSTEQLSCHHDEIESLKKAIEKLKNMNLKLEFKKNQKQRDKNAKIKEYQAALAAELSRDKIGEIARELYKLDGALEVLDEMIEENKEKIKEYEESIKELESQC